MNTKNFEEFSVCQFFADGTHEYVRRFVSAADAVHVAKHYTSSVGAKLGWTTRVIIVDGGDYINFEWKYGEGVTYPPHNGKEFFSPELAKQP